MRQNKWIPPHSCPDFFFLQCSLDNCCFPGLSERVAARPRCLASRPVCYFVFLSGQKGGKEAITAPDNSKNVFRPRLCRRRLQNMPHTSLVFLTIATKPLFLSSPCISWPDLNLTPLEPCNCSNVFLTSDSRERRRRSCGLSKQSAAMQRRLRN